MRIKTIKMTLAALGYIFFNTGFVVAHDHAHHAEPNASALTLDNGKKWATDLPLRQSMEKISKLMNTKLPLIHNERMSDKDYRKLAQNIKIQTDYVFKNCKLSPKADLVLHEILIPILNAETVFKSKDQASKKHDAAVSLMRSLENYGKYFDHKGWGTNGK